MRANEIIKQMVKDSGLSETARRIGVDKQLLHYHMKRKRKKTPNVNIVIGLSSYTKISMSDLLKES